MEIKGGLQQGILVKRYKRFLADIKLAGGKAITIHCPNTGSMKNCQQPGSRVWFSTSSNAGRKYPHTWEVIEIDGANLVGINTGRANALVFEALENAMVPELSGYEKIKREVKYGEQGSRIDILLEHPQRIPCFVEIKNVSLGVSDGKGLFPDAVTTRGQKHLQELMLMKAEGSRAVLFFCVQHSGIKQVSPADEIDPEYGRLLRAAADAGVELLAYRTDFDVEGGTISLQDRIPIVL